MKMDDAIFDACVVIMSLFLVQNIRERTLRICLSRLYFPVRTTPACQQTPALQAQLGRCACLFDRLTIPNKALKPASAVPLEKEQFRHRHLSHCRPWRSHQRVPALRLQQRALRGIEERLPGKPCVGISFSGIAPLQSHHHLAYSSWRRHQMPLSLRPLGARSSH